uniref:Transposase/inactivated derivative n=1 Tax=uncultured bacterium contig00039 TaxID=1181527 RepID=A0A806KNN5_9BACT|nr:transposase/inactivated derivative [uncultured bacterium contig00039]
MLTQKDEDSREALRSLISACLHREVTAVQVINNEIAPTYLKAKSARLDVHVTFNDGEAVDLEMQTSKSNDDLKRRAEYCTGILISAQNAKGIYYSKIKRVYQIFFFDFELFPNSSKLPRRYFYQEEDEHDRLSDLSEILFYELPKFEKWLKDFQTGKVGIENLTSEQKWCLYIKYRHIKQAKPLIEKLCQNEEGIMKAEKSVYTLSRSYERAARRMSALIGRIDHDSELHFAKEEAKAEGHAEGLAEGHAEGLAKGLAKGKAEGQKQILKMLEKGLSIEEIRKRLI